jgi:hypothetical protein
MGRSGTKPRKGKQHQHLPKVGTPAAEHYEQEQERRAVLANMGIRGRGVGFWIGVVIVVVVVLVGIVAWISVA